VIALQIAYSDILADPYLHWDAVHLDVRGGHLVATGSYRYLFWTPRYSDAPRGSVKGAILVTKDNQTVTQLSVENGRVAFAVLVRLFFPLPFIMHAT
jgi:hypothetical protein